MELKEIIDATAKAQEWYKRTYGHDASIVVFDMVTWYEFVREVADLGVCSDSLLPAKECLLGLRTHTSSQQKESVTVGTITDYQGKRIARLCNADGKCNLIAD